MIIDRIVIIGLGSIGKRHLALARFFFPKSSIKVLTRHPENDVDGLADDYLTSLEDTKNFNPQLAVIANPAPFHIEAGIVMASVGAHTLIEKPLSNDISGIGELISVYQNSRAQVLIGYNIRFNESFRRFRDLYQSGVIGRLFSIRAEVGQYLPNWRKDTDYKQTVSAQKSFGGGVLLELSHEIDYLSWLFGLPLWVNADVRTVSNLEIDVEDQVMMILGFKPSPEGGEISASVNLDFIRQDTTRTCTLIGDQGSIKWDGVAGIVYIYGAEQQQWIEHFSDENSGTNSYQNEWEHFTDCVKGIAHPLISGQDGQNVLSVIAAAKKSASTMQRQRIDYLDYGVPYE